jgi:hypothetical protein
MAYFMLFQCHLSNYAMKISKSCFSVLTLHLYNLCSLFTFAFIRKCKFVLTACPCVAIGILASVFLSCKLPLAMSIQRAEKLTCREGSNGCRGNCHGCINN